MIGSHRGEFLVEQVLGLQRRQQLAERRHVVGLAVSADTPQDEQVQLRQPAGVSDKREAVDGDVGFQQVAHGAAVIGRRRDGGLRRLLRGCGVAVQPRC